MLNIGQVVYDYTNKRVIVFAGTEMFQNQKTGECHVDFGFILKYGTFIHIRRGEEVPFKYTNLILDTQAFVGSLINKVGCHGQYFGILDGNDAEVKAWAKEAIEIAEALIAERGLNITEHENHAGKYPCYHIGEPKEYKPQLTISTPNK